jgi:hypothetical protein
MLLSDLWLYLLIRELSWSTYKVKISICLVDLYLRRIRDMFKANSYR